MRLFAFAAFVLAAIAALSASEHEPPNAGLPLVKADYSLCGTVRMPPLLRSPRGRTDYRLGEPFTDKGVS